LFGACRNNKFIDANYEREQVERLGEAASAERIVKVFPFLTDNEAAQATP
jgi:hypothetical protein